MVWEAYVKGVKKFRVRGRIVVLVDANARIGETQEQIGERVYERRSVDKKVEAAGKEFVEKGNAIEMLILNGLRGKEAEYTSFHRSGVGQATIDFVCVEERMLHEWGDVEIGSFGKGESDHEVVMATWRGKVRKGHGGRKDGGRKKR